MFDWFNRPASPLEQAETLRSQAEALLAQDTQEGRQAAHAKLIEALDLLPQPVDQCAQAAALLCTLGDTYFQAGDYATALNAYTDAVNCKNASGDAKVHLRLGKAQFELGEMDPAADEFCRAYLASAHADRGTAIFAGEDEKYFQFLQTRMSEPEDGW